MSTTSRLIRLRLNKKHYLHLATPAFFTSISSRGSSLPFASFSSIALLPSKPTKSQCLPLRLHQFLPLLPHRRLSGQLLPLTPTLSSPAELSDSQRERFLPEFSRVYSKYLSSRPEGVVETLRELVKGGQSAQDARDAMAGNGRSSSARQHYACLSAKEAEAAGVTWHDVSVRRVPQTLTEAGAVAPTDSNFEEENKENMKEYTEKIENLKPYNTNTTKDTHVTYRIYTPPNLSRDAPIVIYFPSGGFVFSGVEYEHGLAAHLSVLTASIVVSVGYRTAPEHAFPSPVHDAIAAVDWVRTNLAGWEWDLDLMELVPAVEPEVKHSAKYNLPTPPMTLPSRRNAGLENGDENENENGNENGEIATSKPPRRKIALLGNGSGGSLAAALGATEGMQKGIDAIGIWCPIVDWTFDPIPSQDPSKHSSLPKSPAQFNKILRDEYGEDRPLDQLPQELLEQLNLTGKDSLLGMYDDIADNPFLSSEAMQLLRDAYLPESSSWTDPFASPLFLFKTPGVETTEPWVDPILAGEFDTPYWPFPDELVPEDKINDLAPFPKKEPQVKERTSRRTTRYPEISQLPLNVPPVRLTLAGSDVLYAQGLEFGTAIRAACFPKKLTNLRQSSNSDSSEAFSGGLFDAARPANYFDNLHQQQQTKSNNEEFDDNERIEVNGEYEPEAEHWVQINTVKGVPNCFVSCAGESPTAYKEVEDMAKWLRGVFDGSHGVNDKILGREWYKVLMDARWRESIQAQAKAAKKQKAREAREAREAMEAEYEEDVMEAAFEETVNKPKKKSKKKSKTKKKRKGLQEEE